MAGYKWLVPVARSQWLGPRWLGPLVPVLDTLVLMAEYRLMVPWSR